MQLCRGCSSAEPPREPCGGACRQPCRAALLPLPAARRCEAAAGTARRWLSCDWHTNQPTANRPAACPRRIERAADGSLDVHYYNNKEQAGGILKAATVMFATGRLPNSRGIGLEASAACSPALPCCRDCMPSLNAALGKPLSVPPSASRCAGCLTLLPPCACCACCAQAAGVALDEKTRAVQVDEYSHTNVSEPTSLSSRRLVSVPPPACPAAACLAGLAGWPHERRRARSLLRPPATRPPLSAANLRCPLLPLAGASCRFSLRQVPSIWAIGDVTDRMNLTPGGRCFFSSLPCLLACFLAFPCVSLAACLERPPA